jgi:hypothetical protein
MISGTVIPTASTGANDVPADVEGPTNCIFRFLIDVEVDWGDLNPHQSGDVTRESSFFSFFAPAGPQ